VHLSLQQAFLDTNPYLLGITIIVSIVHSVFEFLAFKNGALLAIFILQVVQCTALYQWLMDYNCLQMQESS